MDRYMLRAIFRDRFRNIIIMIIVLFCVMASAKVYGNLNPESIEEVKFRSLQNYQGYNALYNEHSAEYAQNYDGNGTANGNKAYLGFELWRIKLYEKNVEMIEEGKFYSKEYQKELKQKLFVESMLDNQFASDPEKESVDKACAKEIKKHKDYLKLEELPFDFKQLPYSNKEELKEVFSEANSYWILKSKWLLSTIDNEAIDYESKSPYVFLSTFCGDENGLSLVLALVILFFSIALVMKWKQKNTFYCICNMNITNRIFFRKYLRNIIAFSSIVIIVCLGVFFVYWGIQGGFSGINCETPYSVGEFDSFSTFDHLQKFDRICLSKMYYDFYFDFGLGGDLVNAGTRHPYSLMKVWQLFLASGVLAFVKMLFYVMLGAGIGFIFVDKSKIIAGGIVAGVLCVTSQLFLSTNKFNPFSVGNIFNMIMGGEGMTYLNAMLVLIVSIVILYTGIMYVISHKDVC